MKEAFLTYAVTLYFDDETSGEIRSLTKKICDATGNDYMIQNDVPPHLTLGMFHINETDTEKLKDVFSEFVEKARTKVLCKKNYEISFGGIESFSDKVIFIKLEKGELLAALNQLLHELFIPHFEAGDNRNYLPENWYPHITLGFKLSHEQFENGMKSLKDSPSDGRGTRIGLACCNPYTPVCEIQV